MRDLSPWWRDVIHGNSKRQCETNKWMESAAALWQSLYRSAVVKQELSIRMKFSFCLSINVLAYAYMLWVVTGRTVLNTESENEIPTQTEKLGDPQNRAAPP